MASSPPLPLHHVVLVPFMSKGHTIPMLHLARLLLRRRNVAMTIVTTPSNADFISQYSLSDVAVLRLPFPQNIPDIPPGVESTDALPSISLFLPFVTATKLMQPNFDEALRTLHPPATCIVSDMFFAWTLPTAKKLGVPRLVFYGMSNYAMALSWEVGKNRLVASVSSDDEPFTLPSFPWIKLTRNDFDHPLNDPNPKGPLYEFVVEQNVATMQSQGIVVNSFESLEPCFLEYVNGSPLPKSWCVGPFCLAGQNKEKIVDETMEKKKWWMEWLDEKVILEGKSVLYVAFGSQAEISTEQMKEISIGLERSGASFLWVLRLSKNSSNDDDDEDERLKWFEGFEERVRQRGVVVKEWVDQMEVLRHEGVKGFMSHCGWNSVIESICAAVPVVAWPVMAEQHLNARMVVEELGIGVRVVGENGSVRGFVKAEMVEEKVRELMEGERGKEARKKVKELAELAKEVMQEGGSSWRTLDALLEEMCEKK